MVLRPANWRSRRLRRAWKVYKALQTDTADDWKAGCRYLDEAAALGPLPLVGRMMQATLPLRGGQTAKAQAALNALIADLDGWDGPNPRYAKAYCKSLLEGIWRHACMAEAGKVAPDIVGVAFYWKGRFPIPDCSYCKVIRSFQAGALPASKVGRANVRCGPKAD